MGVVITGHHVEVTEAIKSYAEKKLDKVNRHFDHVISTHVVLSVEKQNHKAEVTMQIPGHNLHVESESSNLYAAIDLLTDKLDRQVLKNKNRSLGQHQRDRLTDHLVDLSDPPDTVQE